VTLSISAGSTRSAKGVDGVGIIVAVGIGVIVGTAVGGAIVSVAEPLQALKTTIMKIVKRKYLTRTVYAPKNKNNRIILLDFAKANKRKNRQTSSLNAKRRTLLRV